MPRWVLLRHDLPDGSRHLDWMLERRPGEPMLLTFRIAIPEAWERLLAGVVAGSTEAVLLEAERLPDHRRDYLRFEGDVSGGRGRVVRMAEGEILTPVLEGPVLVLAVRWEDCTLELHGEQATEGRWKLRAWYASSAEG